MKVEELVEDIKLLLGADVVNIEMPDTTIEKLIGLAYKRLGLIYLKQRY